MSDDFSDHRFGSGEPFSIGVEEELFLTDADDGRQLDARERVLDSIGDLERGEITGEVQACEVELISDVCASAGEASAALSDLRQAVLSTGVGLIGSATHPSAEEGLSEISDSERYRYISDLLGDAASSPVAAMHVHVGMPDAETAIRVFNGLRRHLPLLEALASNSPFRHGRDSGFASARELSLRAWPRSGAPREMSDYGDFASFAERLTHAAGVPDYTFHWWKLRPHPRLGTVELRALDVQSSLSSVASLVALVHALARHEATATPRSAPPAEILEEASYRAGREGTRAQLPGADGEPRPVREVLAEALDMVADEAGALGYGSELERLEGIVSDGGGAGAQRADYERGEMPAVLEGLLARTKAPFA